MKLAVIEVAGKQYIVQKGDTIETEKLDAQIGEKISLPRVLLTWDGKKLELGQPYLKDYIAEVEVLAKGKGPKVIVFKYKRRKDSRRKVGHRQIVFQVQVNSVSAPAKKEPAEPASTNKKPAPAAAAGKKPAASVKAEKKPAAAKAEKKVVAPVKARKEPAPVAKKPAAPAKKKADPKTADKKS